MNEVLYTAQQVRAIEAQAIGLGTSAYVLMERAGLAAYTELKRRWPQAQRIAVVCGTGNNGGDGLVLARLAHLDGKRVSLSLLGDPNKIEGAAFEALSAIGQAKIDFNQGTGAPLPLEQNDVIVDALFGTGLTRAVEGDAASAVNAMNHAGRPVLALDVPSGLSADTGCVLGAAVRAQVTITYVGNKRGFYTADGPDHCGEIVVDDLGIDAEIFKVATANAELLNFSSANLHKRKKNCHKGDFGHVLVVGGDHGMLGAVRLCAEAALRSGAGLVSVATRRAHAALLAATCPELMAHECEDAGAFAKLLEKASVVAIGPGLGQGEWGQTLLKAVSVCSKPVVIDADGLNLLAALSLNCPEKCILTPHPQEAARLLNTTTDKIQSDRFGAVTELANSLSATVVLKGCGSLIASNRNPMISVCPFGTPAMATAGMGDVLTGVIAAMLAQKLDVRAAAQTGVVLHALAGQRAARGQDRGLLARDLIAELFTA